MSRIINADKGILNKNFPPKLFETFKHLLNLYFIITSSNIYV